MANIIVHEKPAPPIRIDNFAGLNTSMTGSQIEFNESPDMLNIVLDSQGRPDKRFGYERIFPTSLGIGTTNSLFFYKQQNGTRMLLIHHGTQLYRYNFNGAQPTVISSSLASFPSKIFQFGNYVYIMDQVNIFRFDGTNISRIEQVAYIPTLTISTPPTGGGTVYEDFNLIGSAFKQSFSGNGTATTFQLALTNLDITPITAVVNNITINEGSGLSVNRTTGLVTFTVAPTNGTNNVIIIAYKTVPGMADRIKKCTDFCFYGGANDTRVNLYGNENFRNYIFRSGLFDPTYWPENGFSKVGNDAGIVQKMVVQYDSAVILKEFTPNDPTIWRMNFVLNNGVASFPISPINSQISCYAQNSVELIDNSPVFVDKTGIHQLVASNVKDERNTQHISSKIDRSADRNVKPLLEFGSLYLATSVDYDKKYMLAMRDVNDTVFIFDYTLGVWLKWQNVPASCFMEIDGYLYFGDSRKGLVYRFLKDTDGKKYQDDGKGIHAYLKLKLWDFGNEQYLKTAPKLWYHLKPDSNSSTDLTYITDKYLSETVPFEPKYMNQFDYSLWDYSNFTYLLSTFPQVVQAKIKAKKFMYLQVIFENSRIDEAMGILLVSINAKLVTKAK